VRGSRGETTPENRSASFALKLADLRSGSGCYGLVAELVYFVLGVAVLILDVLLITEVVDIFLVDVKRSVFVCLAATGRQIANSADLTGA
jgi:hypothetical protein